MAASRRLPIRIPESTPGGALLILLAVFVLGAIAPRGASAAPEDLEERVAELEERLEQMEETEAEPESAPALDRWLPSWISRTRLSGNADVNYLYGESNSRADKGRFAIENARIFLDIDVGDEARILDQPIVSATSFYFEWDLVRRDAVQNDVGALYLRFDGIAGVRALNLKFGRFAIPFGEEYLRFHEQRPENPLISFSVASPYGWDEGLLVFGSLARDRVHYQLAITDGDYDFNVNSSRSPQIVGRVAVDPIPALHLSLSGLRTSPLGPNDNRSYGLSAMMFGAFGLYPAVAPAYQSGALVGPDPSKRTRDNYAWEVDAILRSARWGHLWANFGQAYFRSGSSRSYDRDLDYWAIEGQLELGALCECLERFYLAARWSAIGTFDSNEGWRLRVMNDGAGILYNTKRVDRISSGIGVRLHEKVVLKLEYSWDDFDLVRGVDAATAALARKKNYFGAGVSMAF